MLPSPTVRGRFALPVKAERRSLERVPAEAFRPRSVPFRVPLERAEAPLEGPRAAQGSELHWVPFGSPPEQAPLVSQVDVRSELRNFVLSGSRRGEPRRSPIGTTAKRTSPPFLSRSLSPKASVPPDAWRKVGSASACAFASRFFLPLTRDRPATLDEPESPPHPPFGRCLDLLSVSGRTDLRLPLNNGCAIRFAPAQSACG